MAPTKALWNFFAQPGFSHVLYHPNGKQIILSSEEETTIRIINYEGGKFDVNKCSQEIELESSITAMALSRDGEYLAVAVSDTRNIDLYAKDSKGDWDYKKTIGRTPLATRCIAFGPQNLLAASGDDSFVRLFHTVEEKEESSQSSPKEEVTIFKGHEGIVQSVEFDPRDEYLASVGSDGTLRVWSLKEAREKVVLPVYAKADPTKARGIKARRVSWFPDGSHIAIPATAGAQYVLVARNTWSTVASIGICSNNNIDNEQLVTKIFVVGPYIALLSAKSLQIAAIPPLTGGLTHPFNAITKVEHNINITGLSWHVAGRSLNIVLVDEEGYFSVYRPEISATLQSPAPSGEEDLHMSEDEEEEEEEEEEDEDGEEEEEEEEEEQVMYQHRVPKNRLRKNSRIDEDDEEDDFYVVYDDDELDKKKKKSKKEKSKTKSVEPTVVIPPPVSPTEYMQPAFQPGSTRNAAQAATTMGGININVGGGLSGKRRLLVWNLFGSITLREEHSASFLDIEFAEENRHKTIKDHYNVSMACISSSASVFASKGDQTSTGSGLASVLQFQPFTAWSSNSEWTYQLPAGESIEAVALGESFVAIATSKRFLRIFSHTGIELQVVRLAGPVVALSGHNDLLLVVYHSGPAYVTSYNTVPPSAEQQLAFSVYEIILPNSTSAALNFKSRVRGEKLPLSPQSTLTWVGFTSNGLIAINDSQGVLQVLSSNWDNSWAPILDFHNAKVLSKNNSEHGGYWIIGLLEDKAICAALRPGETEPALLNKQPIVSLAYNIPLISNDPLNDEVLRLMAMNTVDKESEDTILQYGLQQDTVLLRLFQQACKADRPARAYEFATMLTLPKSYNIATTLAQTFKMNALMERVIELHKERLQEQEKKQQQKTVSILRASTASNATEDTQQDETEPTVLVDEDEDEEEDDENASPTTKRMRENAVNIRSDSVSDFKKLSATATSKPISSAAPATSGKSKLQLRAASLSGSPATLATKRRSSNTADDTTSSPRPKLTRLYY